MNDQHSFKNIACSDRLQKNSPEDDQSTPKVCMNNVEYFILFLPLGPTTAVQTPPIPTQPSAIVLNTPARVLIPPGDFWVTALPVNTHQYVQLNLTIPLRSNFAIFGQRRAPPTHTEYDFVRVHAGSRWHDTGRGKRDLHGENDQFVNEQRSRRSVIEKSFQMKRANVVRKPEILKGIDRSKRSNVLPDTTLSFIEEMVPGLWFIGVYNDGESREEVELEISDRGKLAELCSYK